MTSRPTNIWTQISTLGPVGFLKPGPGTWGSAVAVLLAFVLDFLFYPWVLALIYAITFGVVWYAIAQTEKLWGDHDNGSIVADELLGVWPVCFIWYERPVAYLFIFVIFRFFDILKPWPINYIDQKMKSSLGTIVDDVIAGGFTLLTIYILSFFIKHI